MRKFSVNITAILSAASLIVTIYIAISNHEIKVRQQALQDQISRQEIKANNYESGKSHSAFWNAFEEMFNKQQQLASQLLKDIALTKATYALAYEPKDSKVYRDALVVYKKQGMQYKATSLISVPAGIAIDIFNSFNQSQMFILKYQNIADTLKIRGWNDFSHNTLKRNEGVLKKGNILKVVTAALAHNKLTPEERESALSKYNSLSTEISNLVNMQLAAMAKVMIVNTNSIRTDTSR